MVVATFGTLKMITRTKSRTKSKTRRKRPATGYSRKSKKKTRNKLKTPRKQKHQSGGNVIDGISKSVLNPAIKAVGSAIGEGLSSIFKFLG